MTPTLQDVERSLVSEELGPLGLDPSLRPNTLSDAEFMAEVDETDAKLAYFGEQLARTRAALLEEENKRHLFEQAYLHEATLTQPQGADSRALLASLSDVKPYLILVENCQRLAQRRMLLEERHEQLRARTKRLTQHMAWRARQVALPNPRALRPIRVR